MNVAISILAGVSVASFVMVALPTFFRNIRPQVGSRVQYRDGLYYVDVRKGEWRELREFVTPSAPEVQALYSQIGPSVNGCLEWVCSQIDYRRDWGEFFQFPVETIITRHGDCEDSSLLLCSLLRNFTNAYVILGNLGGWGHAWVVSKEGETLETTYTEARAAPDPDNYCPYIMLNEREVIELWPGALGEVFNLGRDEAAKINLMAASLQTT